MKTAGLIFIWFTMTAILVFWHTSIEDMQSFLKIYVLLAVYLVCIAELYMERKNNSKEELQEEGAEISRNIITRMR